MVLSMWPCKRKLHEEKSKHAGLAQQNSFGPAFFAEDTGAAKGRTHQTLTPAVDWLDNLIGPGGLLLVVSHLLQSQFQFDEGSWKKVYK